MLKVIRVRWVDPSFSEDGWISHRQLANWIKEQPATMDSVGMLVHESDECIVILQSISEGTVAAALQITRTAIVEVIELCEVDLTLDLGEV